MVKIYKDGGYIYKGNEIIFANGKIALEQANNFVASKGEKHLKEDVFYKNTMSYRILKAHNTSGNDTKLQLKFDALASHDITYVGIIQTARASGLDSFPIPYVLTNCHNSLCAVGGTINEDDHIFGLSAAKKYGGIYVPAHQAVIHQYMREMVTKVGSMILGSDSHTRYGAFGTLAIGEGGPELVKQLLSKTYDLSYPEVVAVYLENSPSHGVGPQDVALSLIKSVFDSSLVKNKILEFVGPGIANLSVDYRSGIDVMTTETTCLSSIWMTDDKVRDYYDIHARSKDYAKLEPSSLAYYDSIIKIDLSTIKPVIALPFHPSNVYEIEDLLENPYDMLSCAQRIANEQLGDCGVKLDLMSKIVDGKVRVDQGIVAGCAGGSYENIAKVANIMKGKSIGSDYFNFSVYPASQPIYMNLMKQGAITELIKTGITIKTAFCGPCFGAGDVPGNDTLSIRHTTRNFPSREGSRPSDNQISSVALMDSLSIAATAINKGFLTPATRIDYDDEVKEYEFEPSIYSNRVYQGFGNPNPKEELRYGPNIKDWPKMEPLSSHLLLKLDCVILDPVTTTDELIPSGETSSYRSNPLKLAEYTLSRKDPLYVNRAKQTKLLDDAVSSGYENLTEKDKDIIDKVLGYASIDISKRDEFLKDLTIGSVIFAIKPGDGSAREQAASCQRVLGGLANISTQYATKRYKSNLINWGMLPFTLRDNQLYDFNVGDMLLIKDIKSAVKNNIETIETLWIKNGETKRISLELKDLSDDERKIILAGCLMNSYK